MNERGYGGRVYRFTDILIYLYTDLPTPPNYSQCAIIGYTVTDCQ